ESLHQARLGRRTDRTHQPSRMSGNRLPLFLRQRGLPDHAPERLVLIGQVVGPDQVSQRRQSILRHGVPVSGGRPSDSIAHVPALPESVDIQVLSILSRAYLQADWNVTMPDSGQLDRIDRNILGALSRNGRLSMAELASEVGLSKTPVQ